MHNKALHAPFPQYNSGQMSRILRGFARMGHCYKYYLTALGKQVAALRLKRKELVIVSEPAAACR